MKSRRKNFLIEVLLGTALLVVVVFFVFPIFQNAQITGRIANQKQYLQSVVDALAAYEADHGPVLKEPHVYPPSSLIGILNGSVSVQWVIGRELHSPWPYRIGMAHKLPPAFVMRAVESDWESEEMRKIKEIRKIRWVIIARLPFKDSSEPQFEELTQRSFEFDDNILGSMLYDTTNGIVSAGYNIVSASHSFIEPSVKSAE